VPFRPHQNAAVIKPYNMSIEELKLWETKFADVRYKYFGLIHSQFKLPVGYIRDENGLVQHAQ